MNTNDDEMFRKLHLNSIAQELWHCLQCGAMVCDKIAHKAIHDSLDLQAAAVAVMMRAQGMNA